MWKCASCGEQIDNQFEACWKCGAEQGASSGTFVPDVLQEIHSSDEKILWERIYLFCLLFLTFPCPFYFIVSLSVAPLWIMLLEPSSLVLGFPYFFIYTWIFFKISKIGAEILAHYSKRVRVVLFCGVTAFAFAVASLPVYGGGHSSWKSSTLWQIVTG